MSYVNYSNFMEDFFTCGAIVSSKEILDKCERRLIKWQNVEEAFKNSNVYLFTYYSDLFFINIGLGIQGTKHLKQFY